MYNVDILSIMHRVCFFITSSRVPFTRLHSFPNKKGAGGYWRGFVSDVTESGIAQTQMLLHLDVCLFVFLPGKRNNELLKFKFPWTLKS